MNDNVELALLSGLPFHLEGVGLINQVKLRDIIEMGLSRYENFLGVIMLNAEDLTDDKDEKELLKGKTCFDILFEIDNPTFISEITSAIKFFLKDEELMVDTKNRIISSDRIHLDTESFLLFKEFIALQNNIKSFDDKKEKEENEKARQIKEKMAKAKKTIADKKGENGDPLRLVDIISALTVKSNSLNKINIWDLTIYQLYDEFKRQEHVESYTLGIKSLMNGAKHEEVNLKHWSSKMKYED